MIRLVENWRWVIRRAWSFHLGLLSALFGAFEVAIQIYIYAYEPPNWVPRGWFVSAAVVITLIANVLRLVKQEHDDDG